MSYMCPGELLLIKLVLIVAVQISKLQYKWREESRLGTSCPQDGSQADGRLVRFFRPTPSISAAATRACELFIRSGVSCGRKQQPWTWNGWTVSHKFFFFTKSPLGFFLHFFCTQGSISPHHPACTVIHSRAVTFLLTKMRDKDLPTKEFQMVPY